MTAVILTLTLLLTPAAAQDPAAAQNPAVGQDTVIITAGSKEGRTKITGRILDYNGSQLLLERPGGRREAFDPQRVVGIETQYGRFQTEADAAFAKGAFDQALALYNEAAKSESRRWVRRQIIAQAVWCYRALGRLDRAGDAFLLLTAEDPNTPYFDCIPLAWMPRQPPIALEQAAGEWMQHEQPAAAMLGASHLLTTRHRMTALERLKHLARGPDRRIADLARAQTWRAEVATARIEQIDAWGWAIEKLPEPLAAGPYFVLGLARAQKKQWEQTALAMMRVAILYPHQRALAAQSLLEAGRALEKLDQRKEALRLYRELVRDYADQTRTVTEAQGRIEEIIKTSGEGRAVRDEG